MLICNKRGTCFETDPNKCPHCVPHREEDKCLTLEDQCGIVDFDLTVKCRPCYPANVKLHNIVLNNGEVIHDVKK